MFSEGTGANEREVSVSATKIVLSPYVYHRQSLPSSPRSSSGSCHENIVFLSSLNQVSYCSRTSACSSFVLCLPATVHLLPWLSFSKQTSCKRHLSPFIPFHSFLSTPGLHQIGLILISDTSDPDELYVTKHNFHF